MNRLCGRLIDLRPIAESDCTNRYVQWLSDPAVNRYLETRWTPQDLDSIREFVSRMMRSRDSYLFAIIERGSGQHIGNIKLGPVSSHHRCADISYFLGDRSSWGRGFASEAIGLVVQFGFQTLELHRIQAGLYRSNTGSVKALERNGFRYEGCWRGQLRSGDEWEDHLWFGLLREEWESRASDGHGRNQA
jgi:ribosomal-protein-alanine N-acetyltransferase